MLKANEQSVPQVATFFISLKRTWIIIHTANHLGIKGAIGEPGFPGPAGAPGAPGERGLPGPNGMILFVSKELFNHLSCIF